MRTVAIALAAAGLLAPTAEGATRHVVPGGASSGACEPSAPCSIAWAVNGGGSEAGDVVVLAPGTYAEEPLVLSRALTVTAPRDRPRPVVTVAAPDGVALTVTPDGEGAVVEHVALQVVGPARAALEIEAPVSLEDATVHSDTVPCLRTAAPGLRLEDVRFVQTGEGAGPCLRTTGRGTAWRGVSVLAPAATTAASYEGNGEVVDGVFRGQDTGLRLAGTPVAHRLTASGARHALVLGGDALVTDSVAAGRNGGAAVRAEGGRHTLLNVTAWSSGVGSIGIHSTGGAVLQVRNAIARGSAHDLAADAASLEVGTSIFRTARGVADRASNLPVSPRLVDPVGGDFRLLPGSPAVDAGSFETNAGGTDRAGRFRWLGATPDIGAYEHAPPRPRRPRLDRTAPLLAEVGVTARSFRAGRRGTALSAAARPTGTILRFLVSEPADLVLTVARAGRARPVLGALVVPVERGAGRTKLSGEVDGRLLAPGRYVLTVTARDSTQNLSRSVRVALRVVR